MAAGEEVEAAILEARKGRPLRLLFDYDGTLVPIVASPDLASPDAELLALLDRLVSVADLSIDLVSGRPREILDRWFGHLAVALWAEHGLWRRDRGGEWHATATVEARLLDQVVPLLERFVAITPGTHLERKSASAAWHYRGAHDDGTGCARADELRVLLGAALAQLPLEILDGKKVIEVRFRGMTKAVVARSMEAATLSSTAIVAFGDDRTDEDLFQALPPSSITVAVGQELAGARYQVDDFTAVRRILRRLLAAPLLDLPDTPSPGGPVN